MYIPFDSIDRQEMILVSLLILSSLFFIKNAASVQPRNSDCHPFHCSTTKQIRL